MVEVLGPSQSPMCLRTLIPVQVATRALLENPLSSVACHIFTASLPFVGCPLSQVPFLPVQATLRFLLSRCKQRYAVDCLKRKLGASHAALFAPIPVTTNPFGTPTKPWAHVKNPAGLPGSPTDADISNEARTWVIGQLERAPFPDDS